MSAAALAAAACAAPKIRRLGRVDYEATLAQMRAFTDARDADTPDELWLLEHPPVFTQGQAGKVEHVLAAGDIPVVQADRGGQVTYHGPGQLVVYFLIDLHRRGFGIRSLVTRIEQGMIGVLRQYGIVAYADPAAPGVYVDDAAGTRMKIGSLGLRVRKGCTYHGLALNVAMDLEPFSRINPCGYQGLRMTQTSALGGPRQVGEAGDALLEHLLAQLENPNPASTEDGRP
ncbi:lipoyl(octanoyl) transferase LipB [Solimonas terrae]|uniref:Octanoyltransferase n=1 Tax=Solimonas terrae TaxID=1396819 RepID=A0A6M2BWQ0_9GAMM|nr:lipoyl(octanoyl) transferase LipB [Solimonas terrae]NGY06715.1 lipoyl(octanoyl) transferase LipB [Solimonas terrae]